MVAGEISEYQQRVEAGFEQDGPALVRAQLKTGTIAGKHARYAEAWLARVEHAAADEQMDLQRRAAAADERAADAAERAADAAHKANIIAITAAAMAAIAIAVSIYGLATGRG